MTVVEMGLTLGSAQLGSNVQEAVLNGGAANTVDFSSATNSVYLCGAAGDDTLIGGTGNDYLWGSAGSNTFGFKSGWGHDTVMDWMTGANNAIDLTALASQGLHQLSDISQAVVNGSNVVSSSFAPGNSITLYGFSGTLAASSFHFA